MQTNRLDRYLHKDQAHFKQVQNSGFFDEGPPKKPKCCFCNKNIADMDSKKCSNKTYYGSCTKISHITCLPKIHDNSMTDWCPDTEKHLPV